MMLKFTGKIGINYFYSLSISSDSFPSSKIFKNAKNRLKNLKIKLVLLSSIHATRSVSDTRHISTSGQL